MFLMACVENSEPLFSFLFVLLLKESIYGSKSRAYLQCIDAHTKLLTLSKSLYTAVIFGSSCGRSSSELSEYGKSSRQTNAYPRLFHKSVLYSVLGSKTR